MINIINLVFINATVFMKKKFYDVINQERGDSNFIAIIILIAIVIAVAIAFRNQISGLMTTIWTTITSNVGEATSPDI